MKFTEKPLGERIRDLRISRRLSQQRVAKILGISQPSVSRIEAGKESLSIDQFLALCRLFNTPPGSLLPEEGQASEQVRRSLIRHGAKNLVDDENILPTDRLAAAKDAIKEVLVAAETPREVAALVPVIVVNAGKISFQDLGLELRRLDPKFQRRLGWLLENALAAIERELTPTLPNAWRVRYLRARAQIIPELKIIRSRWDRPFGERITGEDILDTDLISEQAANQARATQSKISKDWSIVTRLQVEDFCNALRDSRS